jgi:hypothetical protein
MNKFALTTEASPNEWQVFQVIRLIDSENTDDLVNCIKSALLSNAVISGVNISDVDSLSVKRNAIWDGSSFSGGLDKEEIVSSTSPRPIKRALLADSKLLMVLTSSEGSIEDELYEAAFSQSIKIVQVTEDQIAAPGYIWDGTSFSAPE